MLHKHNPEFGPELNHWIRKLFYWQLYPYCFLNCLLKSWRQALSPCKLWSFIVFLRYNSYGIRMKLRPFGFTSAGVPAAGFQLCPCKVDRLLCQASLMQCHTHIADIWRISLGTKNPSFMASACPMSFEELLSLVCIAGNWFCFIRQAKVHKLCLPLGCSLDDMAVDTRPFHTWCRRGSLPQASPKLH